MQVPSTMHDEHNNVRDASGSMETRTGHKDTICSPYGEESDTTVDSNGGSRCSRGKGVGDKKEGGGSANSRIGHYKKFTSLANRHLLQQGGYPNPTG